MRRQMKDVGLANDGIIYDTFLDTSNLTHDTRRMPQSLLQGSIASTSRAAIASGSVPLRGKKKWTTPGPTIIKKSSSFFFAKIPPISYLASAIRAANLRPRTYALQQNERLRK
ncbi:hypothetical protein J3E68DRAFT_396179 [Trichoderma sp. SZMC 28012]